MPCKSELVSLNFDRSSGTAQESLRIGEWRERLLPPIEVNSSTNAHKPRLIVCLIFKRTSAFNRSHCFREKERKIKEIKSDRGRLCALVRFWRSNSRSDRTKLRRKAYWRLKRKTSKLQSELPVKFTL